MSTPSARHLAEKADRYLRSRIRDAETKLAEAKLRLDVLKEIDNTLDINSLVEALPEDKTVAEKRS